MISEPTTFASLGLSSALLQALDNLKFTTPSPIQQQTIPWLLQGRDLIGLAQTGTGKTAAFGLPILHALNLSIRAPQALILAPTRELAIQVGAHLEAMASCMPNTQVTVLCGGQDYRPQLKKLREGAHIVVGTPGRILDHLDRGTLQLQHLKTFVLDEADEMLRMGFIEDVESVLSKLPDVRQIALFSATMPSRIRQIATRYLNNPMAIEIRMETATVKSIEQRFVFASQVQKPDALLRILSVEDYQGVIVFVRTKSSTDEVTLLLQQRGLKAMAIHGDITQSLRERVISQFKQGIIDILVATDVAARGLDVDRVTHVINYDMAHDCETYVHRIGRTGRAGRSGTTILFVTPRESRLLTVIERHTRQRIEKMAVPTDHMIQLVKQQRLLQQVEQRLQHEHFSGYRAIIDQFMSANPHVDAKDVAAALALMLHRDKPWKEDKPRREERVWKESDSHARSNRSRREEKFEFKSKPNKSDRGQRVTRQDRDDHNASYPQESFRLDVGRIHGVKPGNIVGAIANEAGLQSRYIRGLKINDDHSIVRLPRGIAKDVMTGLNKAWVCGRQLNLVSLGGD